MTQEQKKQVRDALVRYVNRFPTQAMAADSLQGISSSTISQIKNHNWELLSDRLWQHVSRQVGFFCGEWQPADTNAYLLMRILLGDAQRYAMAYGIAIGEGLGKTFTTTRYARENSAAYYMPCTEAYNRRSFMITLLTNAGIDARGTVPQMMEQYGAWLREQECPLLIIDDAHLLKDRVLHLVVLLANSYAQQVGLIITGNAQLRARITEGVRLKKVGFDEIFRTIGRRFITLDNMTSRDVELVCRANGVQNEGLIKEIAEQSDNLHTVAQLIQRQQQFSIAA